MDISSHPSVSEWEWAKMYDVLGNLEFDHIAKLMPVCAIPRAWRISLSKSSVPGNAESYSEEIANHPLA